MPALKDAGVTPFPGEGGSAASPEAKPFPERAPTAGGADPLGESMSARQVNACLQPPQPTRLPTDPAGRRRAIPQCGQRIRAVMIARAIENARKRPWSESDAPSLQFLKAVQLGMAGPTT